MSFAWQVLKALAGVLKKCTLVCVAHAIVIKRL